MKLYTLLTFALLFTGVAASQASFAYPRECEASELTPTNALDKYEIEDMHSAINYVKFEVPNGGPCAAVLKRSSEYPDWAVGDEMEIYTEGKDFCLENGSVWEIMIAQNVSPHHSMTLRRVDKDEPYNLFGSPLRIERVRDVRARWNMTPMVCPGENPR
jgi:hypothetical protein